MWMTRAPPGRGNRQRSVVTEPARQPMNITRSAPSTIARVGAVPPLLPTTPTASGWLSATLPWPLMVEATGAPSHSASACNSASAPAMTISPPQTRSGLLARSSSSAASVTAAGSGLNRRAGIAPEPLVGPQIGLVDRPLLHVERQADMGRARPARTHRSERGAHDARNVLGRSSTPLRLVSGQTGSSWPSSVRV